LREFRVKSRKDQDDIRESRRILDRVSREAEAGAPAILSQTARKIRDHVSTVNAEQSDPIDYWGTRIGRGLGLVITVALIVGLVIFVARGG
jgi:hypothetical protein